MTNTFKNKSDLHLARKLWHFLGVMFLLIIFNYFSRQNALLILGLLTVVLVSLDVLRQMFPAINNVALKVMGPFIRESERNSYAGTTFLLTAALIVVFFFPPNVANLSLLFLAVADPVASFFGILYGKDKIINNKTLQGSVAAFVSCFIISFSFYFYFNIMTERLLMVSILSALVGASAELIPIGKIDDNFTLPILSASLLWCIFNFFGGF